jgi:hypothetical protein
MEKKEMTLREYLKLTEKNRMDEELTRPRVEIWPDEWAEWVASHRKDRQENLYCHGSKSSPLCPNGIH